MAEKRKFRVNEEKRIVRAYNEDIVSREDFEELERYTRLGYKVILIPKKPKEYRHIKNDMITFLEGNIDDKIYKDFIDNVEKKVNFLKLKWSLLKALEDKENEGKKENEKVKLDFSYIDGIINQAKSKKYKLIEKAKEKAESKAEEENRKKNESDSKETK